jgi:acyl-coenzyme A thioesterase PaaI-like protein
VAQVGTVRFGGFLRCTSPVTLRHTFGVVEGSIMLASLTQNPLLRSIKDALPPYFTENVFMNLFGLTQVPLLFYLRPKVIELTRDKCIIKIPLRFRSKNHLGSMYFGSLAAGADCAGGFMAMKLIYEQKLPLNLVFKDFHAEFLRRAQGDVFFVCEDGQKIQEQMNTAMRTGERCNETVVVTAYVPADSPTDPVARFELTLSVKRREAKN